MSGLCGIVERGDSPVDPSLVERMASTIPARVAAGQSRWNNQVAALAQLGAEAPAHCDGITLCADARLDDRDHLIRTLQSSGPGETATDHALIVAAYRRWGLDCAEHLVGDYAFALWDATARRLLLARDAVGARPLCYAMTPSRVAFASDPAQLLADPHVPRTLDGYYLADYLTSNHRDHARTVYAAIRWVPPGHALMVEPGREHLWRHWHPDRVRSIRYRDEREYASHLRDLIERAVLDRLRTTRGRVAIMTSGGLDSTTVAATAQAHFDAGRSTARPLALTEVFDEVTVCDERTYTRDLADHAGLELVEIPVEPHPILPADKEWAPPRGTPVMAYEGVTHALLARARSAGCDLLLTGLGGDSHFDAGRLLFYRDARRLRWDRLVPWIVAARRAGRPLWRSIAAHTVWPLLPGSARRWVDRRGVRRREWHVPAWLRREFVVRADVERRLAGQGYPRRFDDPVRQRQYEDIVGLAQQNRMIEWFSSRLPDYGMVAAYPLMDRRLSEYLLAIPLELLARPGPAGNKALLRESTRGLLPETVRIRSDKTSWGPFLYRSLCSRERGRIAGRLTASRLEELGLVDERVFQQELERFCQDGRGYSPIHFFFAASLEHWIRSHATSNVALAYTT